MIDLIKRIVKPENGIETVIIGNADFIAGASYGKPRSGHPEGQVIYHIEEVLGNIEKYYGKIKLPKDAKYSEANKMFANEDEDRQDLRVIALVHDTFKYKVDQTKPKVGANHHATIARIFAEKYITDYKVLTVIEKHDEAYNAWSIGGRHGDWYKAERRANQLIQGLLLEGCLDLYVKFYRCDNATGDKEQENYEWFINLIK